MIVMLSFLFPSLKSVGNNRHKAAPRTFDGVGLDKLRAVNQERLRDILPCHALRHPEVDVCGGKFVDVEPDVLRPGELDQVLVCSSGIP